MYKAGKSIYLKMSSIRLLLILVAAAVVCLCCSSSSSSSCDTCWFTCCDAFRLQNPQQKLPSALLLLHSNRAWGGGSSDNDTTTMTRAAGTSSIFLSSCVYGWRNFKERRRRQRLPTRTTSSSSSWSALSMGKGDGKKKRKKMSGDATSQPLPSRGASPATSASSSPAELKPQPLRVLTNVNIPVRKQIALANLNKAQQRQTGDSFRQKSRTAYRRTWDEEELEVKALERRQRGQDPDWDVILNRTASSPLMIVDGYNIIYKWPRLKKHMQRGDPGRARQLLVDDLENLRSLKGWRIECVFDGTRRSTVGPLGHGPSANPRALDQATRQSVSKHGVRVVFSGVGSEADSYIESRCARAKNVTDGEITGSFIVATDDAMIRLAGQSAGALCMSADRMVTELKAVKKAVDYQVEAAVARVNGHSIRPEQLRGSMNGGTVTMPHRRFGRNSVVVEDKRNRTKAVKVEEEYDIDLSGIKLEEDENGIPWWAKVPDQANPYK